MFQQRDLGFLYRYFVAEKQESLVLLTIGIIAILFAILCWFFIKSNPNFYKGIAIPLLAIGLVQSIVGYAVYGRTDDQKTHIAYNMGLNPVSFVKQTELPRMRTVMKNFVAYRWMEIAFIITGMILVLLFRNNGSRAFWYGFGIALAVEAVIMLGADHFAEKRGKLYTMELEKMSA